LGAPVTFGPASFVKEINDQIGKSEAEIEARVSSICSPIKTRSFRVFDPAFLGSRTMKEKKLAAELLRTLLTEQIMAFQRTNLVQARNSRSHGPKYERYRNGLLPMPYSLTSFAKWPRHSKSARGGRRLRALPSKLVVLRAITKPRLSETFTLTNSFVT
jgi:type I restriction enzyme R subunit